MQVSPELTEHISQILGVYRDAFVDTCRIWANEIVFTWHWWLALGLTIAPWAFWAFVHDKMQTRRLFNAGFITLLIASLLDMIGIYIGLWQYHTMVVPLVPAYLPFDWSFMPVTAMLFYQFAPPNQRLAEGRRILRHRVFRRGTDIHMDRDLPSNQLGILVLLSHLYRRLYDWLCHLPGAAPKGCRSRIVSVLFF